MQQKTYQSYMNATKVIMIIYGKQVLFIYLFIFMPAGFEFCQVIKHKFLYF